MVGKILFSVLMVMASVTHAYEMCLPTLEFYLVDNHYEIVAEITAYYYLDEVDASGTGIAADGTPAVPDETIAVDPNTIPLGSKVYIPTQGWRRANDTGSAVITKTVNGQKVTVIDLCKASRKEAFEWGRRTKLVKVIPPNPSKRLVSKIVYPPKWKMYTLEDAINAISFIPKNGKWEI